MNAEHRSFFKQRFKAMKEGAATHPYAEWVAVVDSLAPQGCVDLHGKVWRVQGQALVDIVSAHLKGRSKYCRCRLRPIRQAERIEDGS